MKKALVGIVLMVSMGAMVVLASDYNKINMAQIKEALSKMVGQITQLSQSNEAVETKLKDFESKYKPEEYAKQIEQFKEQLKKDIDALLKESSQDLSKLKEIKEQVENLLQFKEDMLKEKSQVKEVAKEDSSPIAPVSASLNESTAQEQQESQGEDLLNRIRFLELKVLKLQKAVEDCQCASSDK